MQVFRASYDTIIKYNATGINVLEFEIYIYIYYIKSD